MLKGVEWTDTTSDINVWVWRKRVGVVNELCLFHRVGEGGGRLRVFVLVWACSEEVVMEP